MDAILATGIQALTGIASLLLVSLGLAIVFGMMRVINLAHGEFLMLGAYSAILAVEAGVNLWVAMLVVAPVCVGLLGAVVERLVIRRLYGRMVDTMLATWGLSLALIGAVTMIFGNTVGRLLGAARQRADRRLFDLGLRAVPDRRDGGAAGRGLGGAALHPGSG